RLRDAVDNQRRPGPAPALHGEVMSATPALRRVGDAPLVRHLLIGTGIILSILILVMPLVVIFTEAFSAGIRTYLDNLSDPETLHAIGLTVLTAIVVVPINIGFGIAAAWLISKHQFPGKKLLISVIELPFSVSPVIAGVTYLFLYGDQGLLGPWLREHDLQVMFTVPAIMLVSLFVTSPFVARELIPLMQTQGSEEEEASLSLGASGFTT